MTKPNISSEVHAETQEKYVRRAHQKAEGRKRYIKMKIGKYLDEMIRHGASDLYMTVGAKVGLRVNGKVHLLGSNPLGKGSVEDVAAEIMSEDEQDLFDSILELNLGLTWNEERFRVNVYRQRGEVSLVARHIKSIIPNPDDLNLPKSLKDLVMRRNGLVLFVGATGSGKSTSLAALIEYRNRTSGGHIITVEDPIEFSFKSKLSIIGQREIGLDTLNYANAMREAMREAPDMIMVGETRTQETMEALIGFADSGHLVLSTLHATNAIQALDRMLYLYPADSRMRLLMDLSLNLRGIVAQRLIPSIDGGRMLVTESMLNTPFVSELIRKGKFHDIRPIMEKGGAMGMQTFDQGLVRLFREGKITREEALNNADSRNELEWKLNFSKEEMQDWDEDPFDDFISPSNEP